MSKKILEADAIMSRATPVVPQQAHEIQPYGHIIRLPNALSATAIVPQPFSEASAAWLENPSLR